MREVKIYTLSDPITKQIRYIGKTVESLEIRLDRHIRKKDNTYRYNWILSLKKQNLKPIIELLDITDEDNWCWIEKYWISQFKCWGFSLVNTCEGGYGTNGQKHRPESIEKMRIASKGNKNFYGKKHKLETIENIRKKLIGRKLPQHIINDIANKKRGIPCGVGRKHKQQHIENITIGTIKKIGKPIIQYNKNGDKIKEYDAVSIASKELNIPLSNIVEVCKKRRKSAGNFVFNYKE